MSILSSIKSAASKVASKVKSVASSVKNAVNKASSSLSASAINSSSAKAKKEVSAANNALAAKFVSTPGPSTKNIAGAKSTPFTPSAATKLAATFAASNPAGTSNPFTSLSSGSSRGATPASWDTPVTISAGSKKSSSPSSLMSKASYQPTTIGTKSLGGMQSFGAEDGGGGVSTSRLSLASAPTASNPGKIDNSAIAGTISDYYQYDPTSGQMTPKQEDAESTDALSVFEKYYPKKESVLDDPDVAKQQKEVRKQKKIVTDYTSQLNAVVAKQNQDLLQLRQTGSQEGVTEAVYGGQATTVNREAAIKALPLQASVAAAQGNLELAQDFLQQITDMKKEEIDNNYDFKVSQYNAIDKYVTGERKERLDRLKVQEERLYNERKDALRIEHDLMTSAVSQEAPARVVSAITNAKTVNEKIAAAGIYAGDVLDREYKQAQLNALYSKIAARDEEGKVVVDQNGKVVLSADKASALSKELVNNDAYKAIRKGQDSLQTLKQFENLFSEIGSTSKEFSPFDNNDLKSRYTAAILNLKEFFNLGVVNGPDERYLMGILPDPTDKAAVNIFATNATQSGLTNMKNLIENTLDDRFQSVSAQYGDYSADSLNSLKDLQRVYINQKVALRPELYQLIEENPDMSYEDIISVIANQ